MSISSDELRKRILQWSADERQKRSTSRRITASVQQHLAETEARFSGLLIDLFESQRAIAVLTVHGRHHEGVIGALGKDFCALSGERTSTMIHLNSIEAIQLQAQSRNAPTASNRELGDHLPSLSDVIDELAADRLRVRFILQTNNEVREGELFSAGEDLCSIAIDAPTPTVMFVPVDSFSELAIV